MTYDGPTPADVFTCATHMSRLPKSETERPSRALPARRHETSLKAGFGLRLIGKSRQQLAPRTMDLRFAPALAGLVDLLLGLVQKTKPVRGRRRTTNSC